MAGLGRKTFTSGEVLTAANTQGYLMDQSVMVFADEAARTSAIAAPTEGMHSYLSDTDSTEYYSGSAWAAVGAAGGMDLITPTSVAGSGVSLSGGQVTFTAASTASINGCFTATYDNYVIFLSTTLSAAVALNFRLRVAGVDSSAAIYSRNYFLSRTVATGGAHVNATSQILNLGEDTSLQVFKLEVFGPAIAAYTHTFTQNKNNYTELNIQGMSHAAATAYDGFTLFPASGTFTGTLRVYGLRNS